MPLAATCHWHPNRRAIGVCVEFGEPMCAECSTPFRGVNLSRAGVERRLEAERAVQAAAVGGRAKRVVLVSIGWLLVAPALWLLHTGWSGAATALARTLRGLATGDAF